MLESGIPQAFDVVLDLGGPVGVGVVPQYQEQVEGNRVRCAPWWRCSRHTIIRVPTVQAERSTRKDRSGPGFVVIAATARAQGISLDRRAASMVPVRCVPGAESAGTRR